MIAGLGRSSGERNSNHSSILAWRIPRTEEPGRPQSTGSQSQTRLKQLSTHADLYAGSEQGCEGYMGIKTDKYPCRHSVYNLVEVGNKNHTAMIAHCSQ